mgnify:CR=1 FL=1
MPTAEPLAFEAIHRSTRPWTGPGREALRRAFDLVAATLLLVLSAPVAMLAALAIRIEDQGPVLFRQTRVGYRGTPFLLVKFRSMHVDAEADGVPRWAEENDPRVTRVGRIIRLTRVDELPQLWNVLRGEMSLIGPRPERPAFVERLSRELPGYRLRHAVKPGVTGLAQVCAGYAASLDAAARKLDYDLHYVANRSLRLDLRILAATVWVVLTAQGAR